MWGFESSIPSHEARSSSGPGHRPLKAKIAGSNPARATTASQRPRYGGACSLPPSRTGQRAGPPSRDAHGREPCARLDGDDNNATFGRAGDVTSREANTRSAEDLTGDVLAGALAARAAAEEAGDRYRALVESAPDGIVEVDGRGRIVLVNRETQRLFGYGGDELIGQSVGILIPERFREAHIQHEAKYARAPGLRAMGSGLELVGRRKDGTEFPSRSASALNG